MEVYNFEQRKRNDNQSSGKKIYPSYVPLDKILESRKAEEKKYFKGTVNFT